MLTKKHSIWSDVANFLNHIEAQNELQADLRDLREKLNLSDEEIEGYLEMFRGNYNDGEIK